MITSYALKEGGILQFPDGNYTVITISEIEVGEVYCVLRKKNSKCIKTIFFQRVGEKIKSGIDLGECLKYIPPKKIPSIGQKYGDVIIQEILRKTEKGWHCLVSYGSAISYFLRIIPE
jgi:hypothetical protein